MVLEWAVQGEETVARIKQGNNALSVLDSKAVKNLATQISELEGGRTPNLEELIITLATTKNPKEIIEHVSAELDHRQSQQYGVPAQRITDMAKEIGAAITEAFNTPSSSVEVATENSGPSRGGGGSRQR